VRGLCLREVSIVLHDADEGLHQCGWREMCQPRTSREEIDETEPGTVAAVPPSRCEISDFRPDALDVVCILSVASSVFFYELLRASALPRCFRGIAEVVRGTR
jgi:hypothetical protein